MASASPEPPTRLGTTAWIAYDLANTVFSFAVVSTFYPLWLNKDLGLPDTVFAVASSGSMAVVLVLAPGLGLLSDRTRRRIPFLVVSTVVCVVPTFGLGFVPWPLSVSFFVVANVGFQAGLIFYDALLPAVSTPENRGRVGSLGVGFGYLGSFLGLAVGRLILSGHEERDAWVFAAAAVLFLLLAVPAFLFVPDLRGPVARFPWAALPRAIKSSFAGLRRLAAGRDVPHVGRFLLGRVFYTDAANTMILFMSIYVVREAGFSEAGVTPVLAMGILGAFLLAPLWGLLVDRIGPRHALSLVLLTWMFGLTVVVLVPVLDLPKEAFYPLAFLLGAALGGMWSADRPLLLGLVPAHRVGEFYGIYAMMGRFAAIAGPLLWAFVVDGLGWGRPAAVLSLLGFMIVAWLILQRVPDPTRGGPTPLHPFLPWRAPDGARRPLPRPWWARFPATAAYAAVTTVLFVAFAAAYGADSTRAPRSLTVLFVYQIPELVTDPGLTLLHFATGIWVNWHIVQLVYVLVLLALFGALYEIREGTRRAALVFYATSIVAGLVAGLLLHVVRAASDAAWIDKAWVQGWTGGSAGAFGLMGALAARARRPWLLLTVFVVWELNVGLWFLRSYTPAFHLTALAAGFLMGRYALKPRPRDGGVGEGMAKKGGPAGPRRTRQGPAGE